MLDLKEKVENINKQLGINNIDEVNKFPRYIEIEAYDGCNINCIMCPLGKNIYEGKGGIDLKTFEKIAVEMSNYKNWIRNVSLSRNGEPLLNKNLAKMVKLLKDNKVKRVNFSTNATALTEKRAEELLEAGLDEIRFSIDGYTKKTFESIRKDANFEKVITKCLRYIKIRDERYDAKSRQIQIRLVKQEKNENEVTQWREYWLSKLQPTDVVASKKMHNWGNGHDYYEGNIAEDNKIHAPCISPFSTLEVLWDGTVPLCGCDYKPIMNFGNVKEKSLQEIWNCKEFKKVREIHITGKRNEISLCVGCNVWESAIRTIHTS